MPNCFNVQVLFIDFSSFFTPPHKGHMYALVFASFREVPDKTKKISYSVPIGNASTFANR